MSKGSRALLIGLGVACLGVGLAAAPARGQCDPEQKGKLVAANAASWDYFGCSVSASVETVLIGAAGDDDGGGESGSAHVFVRSSGAWLQQAKLAATDAAAGDSFGISVSVSGDTAVIGAPFDDDGGADSGSAYVFVRSGGVWTPQAKLTAVDAAAGDCFGIRVSVSGDTAVIGADNDDDGASDSGSAYVFVRSGGVWAQQAKLLAADAEASDCFGSSVSVSGDAAVIGTVGDDDGGAGSGSAYVFARSGSVWTQQAKLTATDAAEGDGFGGSVSVSGATAVIGASHDGDSGSESAGSAYVFIRVGETWTQQAKLTAAPHAAAWDYFGCSVSVSGDIAVIGADGKNPSGLSDAGLAYVFVRSSGVWSRQASLIAADAAAGDWFGYSVAVSGDTAVIGALGDEVAGRYSGSAYVFDLNCLGACCLADGTCLSESSADDCAAQGGAFQPGIGCDPDPCGPPTGACCYHYGLCLVQTEADCVGFGGTVWLAGQTCDPNPCPFFKGDVNCDHLVNADDIPQFVAALIGGYTGCDLALADMDNSSLADGQDIQGFVTAILFPPP